MTKPKKMLDSQRKIWSSRATKTYAARWAPPAPPNNSITEYKGDLKNRFVNIVDPIDVPRDEQEGRGVG